MSDVYNGKEPYIFISYAHKDAEEVLPLVQKLLDAGYRVWYDSGIEIGTEWPEYIATKLFFSRCVLAFISPNAVNSKNCRREINFAIDKDKELLSVYLEEFELPLGMQMQLNTLQAFLYTKTNRDATILDKLCQTPSIKECLQAKPAPSESTEAAKEITPVKVLATDSVPVTEAATPLSCEAAPAVPVPQPPSLPQLSNWRCHCGTIHTGDIYRCDCGGWRCTCGLTNASYISNCRCGRSKRDIPQVRPARIPVTSAPTVVQLWNCVCGLAYPNHIRKCTCGAWHCICGQVNANYVSSCSCGLSKRDSLRL